MTSLYGMFRRRTILRQWTIRQCMVLQWTIRQRTLRQTNVDLTDWLGQLPLELLDIVLEKSFLHWIAISSPDKKNEDIVKALASVDFCWFQRMTKRRVKRRIWQRLKDFYERTIRNSRNYLLENIHPTNELVNSLMSTKCLTEEQGQIIRRQRSNRGKNDKILHVIRSFNDARISSFVWCLWENNQNTVARIMENGGGVIKVKVQNRDAECKKSLDIRPIGLQKLHEGIKDLRNRNKLRSHQTGELIIQLEDEGIEILNSQLDKESVVVWIWCRMQPALEHVQKLFESSQLIGVLYGLANIEPSSSETMDSKVVNIDSNQFRKTGAVYPLPKKTLDCLPLELIDIILEKSFLHWIAISSYDNKNEDVVKALTSVDYCWFHRIRKQRTKKRIWRRLKDFYERTRKLSAIIRNNENYLIENINPTNELVTSLLSINFLTEEESDLIQRQRSNREKNAELLYVIRTFDDTKFSNFVSYLRQSNQNTVARIIQSGGDVIKVKVQNRDAKCKKSVGMQTLHEKLEDLKNRTIPRSHRTDELISQLKKEGIKILNSQLKRQTMVVWIWCRSQSALEYIQKLYESKQLVDVLHGLADIRPSTSDISQSKLLVIIDSNQFKKTVVVCSPSARFAKRIEVKDFKLENSSVEGVAKLREELLIIFQTEHHAPNIILVFEDRNPFRLKWKIEIPEIRIVQHVGSSVKENCLYVSDAVENCVWKITIETDDQQKKINKWLNIYDWITRSMYLSVINDGVLLIVEDKLSGPILVIYGSDAKLSRSIPLPKDIQEPLNAVETSIGNFIIFHRFLDNLRASHSRGATSRPMKTGLCELTRDGQMIVSRFSPSNETQKLSSFCYSFLDSDDRLFVADYLNERVVLFDSDLKWNRILVATKEEKDEKKFRRPKTFCYDEQTKQLIVGCYGPTVTAHVNVYILNFN